MKRGRTSYHRRFVRKHWAIGGKCLLVGLIGGTLVSLYRLLVTRGADGAQALYAIARVRPAALVGIIAAAVVGGLVIAWLVKRVPMAGGSGIPQTEGVLSHQLRMRALPILAARFAAGGIGAVLGLSLGHAAPSVQVGAAAGQLVRDVDGEGGFEESCLVTAGAAAGLAAAFTAPLAGLTFALEEVHRSFSPFMLVSAGAGALSAAFVATAFFGITPLLDFTHIGALPVWGYLLMIPLGIAVGLAGSLMNKLMLGSQRIYACLPSWSRPMVALLAVIPFGLACPQVMGGGTALIQTSELMAAGAGTLALLLLAKLALTCTSFGSGTPGGIFTPLLAMGALAGALTGLGAHALGAPSDFVAIFAVCGMAGFLAASLKAPVTGIVLVVELTGSLAHILPLIIVAFVALAVSDSLSVSPLYGALLDRYLDAHGEERNDGDPDRIMDVRVEKGSALDGCPVGGVDWPTSSLLLSLHKAERIVVPRESVRIRHGDHLVAMPVGPRPQAKRELLRLAQGPGRKAV